ncbi:MAG TPA: DinB family protein [Saprospiraceae bacterium]|nr:DinB family protein [Saprospiraceae bacterium]
MESSIKNSVDVLNNTPNVLSALMNNLSDKVLNSNEGENTWSVKEVIAHLVICEETNWLQRIKIILSNQNDKVFAPIDLLAHFDIAQNNSISSLLERFKENRKINISEIEVLDIQESDFVKTAVHPVIGKVNLNELLSTWVAHDLTHLSQITRVMAKQYKNDIGPFIFYLNRLK